MSTKDTVQKFARNIWLAGLGAYGKSAETLTEQFDKAYVESNQLFNDLLNKGDELNKDLQERIVEKTQFESKVDEVRAKLGLNQTISDEQLDALAAKVDTLTAAVAVIAEQKLQQAKTEVAAKATQAKAETPVDEVEATTEAAEPAAKTSRTTRKPRSTRK